ncbi:hypothetical protein BC938DRAFT_471094 [Jimgerdemannia flammicorona]|uniref:Uncharacterized protein n=1 Tax=Jimgerdemannia flammicorona TaxID=994334 RepID=A0A433QUY6_9FUNG|nr:hypothetical protein BC938DRAFT_471094 [Jimgerdemannia flammicorona]
MVEHPSNRPMVMTFVELWTHNKSLQDQTIAMQNGKQTTTTSRVTDAPSCLTRAIGAYLQPSPFRQSVHADPTQLKGGLQSKDEIIRELKSQLLEYELKEITSRFEQLTLAAEPTTICKLKSKVEERDRTIDELNSHIAHLQKEMAEQLAIVKKCRMQLGWNNAYIIQQATHMEEFQQEGEQAVSELHSRNQILEMQRRVREDAMAEAQAVWQDDKKFTLVQLAVCEARVAELEADKGTAVDQFNARLYEMQGSHADVVRVNNDLMRWIGQVLSTVELQRLQFVQFEKEKTEQIGELETKLAMREVQAKAMENKTNEMVSRLQSDLVLERGKVVALEERLAKQDVDTRAMQETIVERNGTVTRLEGELALESVKVAALERKLKEKAGKLDETVSQFEELKAERDRAAMELEKKLTKQEKDAGGAGSQGRVREAAQNPATVVIMQ